MPSIAHAISGLSAIAPFTKAAAWDPVGLQFGDLSAPAERLAVCHEVTEDVVDRLEREPVDLLVSYHPLLFKPTTRLVSGPGAAGRAFRLIRAGIALAVVHTAYDTAPGGTANALARSLDLCDVSGFGPLWRTDSVTVTSYVPWGAVGRVLAAMAAAGGGSIGYQTSCSIRAADPEAQHARITSGRPPTANEEGDERLEVAVPAAALDTVVAALVSAHPDEDPLFQVVDARENAGFVGRLGSVEPTVLSALVARVAERLGGVVRVAPAQPSTTTVTSIAVVPGSGGSLISDAAACGAEVLVTGDVSHHQARDAIVRGVSIIDPGHAPTERPGVANLYAAVSALGATLDLTSLGGGPWEEPE